MFAKHLVWNILLGLVLVAALAGCGAAPTAAPNTPTIPTIDTKPTFDAISTQAAQTVVANMTANAPTATPVLPTNTATAALPTNTPAPTDTPAPTSTPTHAFIPWTQTPTPTQAAYSCSVTNVEPKSSDTIKVNQDFDGKWSLKNTGTKTWLSGNTDIRFISGTKFQTNGDVVDLTSDVAPNGTYTVVVDMKAPSGDGSYSASWGVYLEDGSVCTLNLNLTVKK